MHLGDTIVNAQWRRPTWVPDEHTFEQRVGWSLETGVQYRQIRCPFPKGSAMRQIWLANWRLTESAGGPPYGLHIRCT